MTPIFHSAWPIVSIQYIFCRMNELINYWRGNSLDSGKEIWKQHKVSQCGSLLGYWSSRLVEGMWQDGRIWGKKKNGREIKGLEFELCSAGSGALYNIKQQSDWSDVWFRKNAPWEEWRMHWQDSGWVEWEKRRLDFQRANRRQLP